MSEPPAETPRRTAPLGVLVGALGDIRQSLLPAAAGAYGLRHEMFGLGFIAAFAVLLLAIGGLTAFVRWWRTTYVVGAEAIRLDSGVIRRTARAVPYERIQDVSLEQPLLARALGLVQVRIETGAGGADEIVLAFLPLAEGEALRELVRDRREDAPPARAATAMAEPAGEVLFAMPLRRLIIFGLFEFSLAAFAVAAGAAQQLDFLLPEDFWDWDRLRRSLDAPLAQAEGLGPLAQAAGAALAVGALVIIGFATGLVRTVARDWGFVLERTPRGFRRRRGLFTRTDVVMPAHRVQAALLTTGWLRRRFGWHGLRFVSLAQDAGSASHDVAPFARIAEVAPIAAAAGFPLPGAGIAWRRPAARAFLDRAALGALAALAVAAGLAASPAPAAAVVPLLALPAIAARQAFLWRHARHAIDHRQVYARRGWLAPRLTVANRAKLQSTEIAQGPLARRGGYATLHLGLAGGTLSFDGLPLAEAREMREAILGSIAAVDFSALR